MNKSAIVIAMLAALAIGGCGSELETPAAAPSAATERTLDVFSSAAPQPASAEQSRVNRTGAGQMDLDPSRTRLARSTRTVRYWVARGTDVATGETTYCLNRRAPDGSGQSSGCTFASDLEAGRPIVEVANTDAQFVVSGLIQNGVAGIGITLADGSTVAATLINNVFHAEGAGTATELSWISPEGKPRNMRF